jgi:hypothetical protein
VASLSRKRRLTILALFTALLFDIAYAILSWPTPCACPMQISPVMKGSNLQILAQPSFYTAYYAIVGSVTIVIMLLAPAERPSLWKNPSDKKEPANS